MKLDNLLEQMMMMQQQQQQAENVHGEMQQNRHLQQNGHDEGPQRQQQWADAQKVGTTTTTTNGLSVQTSNNQNVGEQSTSTNNAKKKKSDELSEVSSGTKNAAHCKNPFQIHRNQQQQQPLAVGGTNENNGRESLPQHLEFFSAFLRANLPLLPTFSTPSLPLQQNSILPNLTVPTPQQIVPLSKEIASQGLLAVGGCRPCHKTFTSRLELIHHCVDHFPNVFYSFEERQTPNNGHIQQQPKNDTQNLVQNNCTDFQQSNITFADATQKIDVLGQLAGLLAFNENGSSGNTSEVLQSFPTVQNSLLANFFKSFAPIPLQQLATVENGTKHLATNGTTENIKEQPQKRTNAPSSSGASHPKQASRPSSSSNSSKTTSSTRKRQICHEKATTKGNEKGQTEDGSLTSSVEGNKSQRKSNGNGGDRQRNGNTVGGGGGDAMVKSSTSPTTAPTMPSLSELPYSMCPYCFLTFAEKSAFRAHLSVHESEVTAASASSSSTTTPFMASTLVLSPTNADAANGGAEAAAAHSQQQTTLKCLLCEMKFANAFRLTEHMRLHSAHTCNQCQKTFMTAFDLNLHMGTHTGFTYDCKDCGKCFPCRKTLAEHNRSHRMILSGGGGSASPELASNNKAKPSESVFGQQQDREHSPDFGGLNSDSGSEKRRMRMAKRGEKSRRNATLVALESAVPSPPIALPTSTALSSSFSSPDGVPRFSNDTEGETEID